MDEIHGFDAMEFDFWLHGIQIMVQWCCFWFSFYDFLLFMWVSEVLWCVVQDRVKERENGLFFVSFGSWENAQENEGENFVLDARSGDSGSWFTH